MLKKIQVLLHVSVLITVIVSGSILSVNLWNEKHETVSSPKPLAIDLQMTIAQFGQANQLSNPQLKAIFDLKNMSDLETPLNTYGTLEEVTRQINKKMALAAEGAQKNWIKIPVKFGLWILFLSGIFIVFKNRKLLHWHRITLLWTAVFLFGIALSSDPGPMGTIKDAIFLYATTGGIFIPRLVAMLIFLVGGVFLVNKFICAWGCQAGTLQDLIFHINQHHGKPIMGKQFKLPFVWTNSVRILTLIFFTGTAVIFHFDVIHPIDPFKIYNPVVLAGISMVFLAGLLVLSLFIYRPWCHLMCPFGLMGWLVEKISLTKISVDYTTCIACGKCTNACPTDVMEAILNQNKKTIPDCFACLACRDACPTHSIQFSTRKRVKPLN